MGTSGFHPSIPSHHSGRPWGQPYPFWEGISEVKPNCSPRTLCSSYPFIWGMGCMRGSQLWDFHLILCHWWSARSWKVLVIHGFGLTSAHSVTAAQSTLPLMGTQISVLVNDADTNILVRVQEFFLGRRHISWWGRTEIALSQNMWIFNPRR